MHVKLKIKKNAKQVYILPFLMFIDWRDLLCANTKFNFLPKLLSAALKTLPWSLSLTLWLEYVWPSADSGNTIWGSQLIQEMLLGAKAPDLPTTGCWEERLLQLQLFSNINTFGILGAMGPWSHWPLNLPLHVTIVTNKVLGAYWFWNTWSMKFAIVETVGLKYSLGWFPVVRNDK